MAGWQVTGRLKTGVAALAGAVVVSMVAPGVAEAAAANRDTSSVGDSADHRSEADDVQARHKVSDPGPGSGPATSAPRQQSSTSSSSPGFGQASPPSPTQRKDKPPDRDPHKFSPQQRSSADASPGSAPGSNPAATVGSNRRKDRDPDQASPRTRLPAAPVPYRDSRNDRPGASSVPTPGRSGANGSAMQQLLAWTPPKPKKAKKSGTHDLANRYRIVVGRPGDPTVHALDEDVEIWGIPVWDRDTGTGQFIADVVVGVADGVTGTVDFFLRITNPDEYDEMLAELRQIVQLAQEDPVELLKRLANWEQWQTEPGRALGNTAYGFIPGVGVAAKLRTLGKASDSGRGDASNPETATQQPAPTQPPAPQQQQIPQQPAPPQPTPGQATDATPGAPIPDRAPGDRSSTGAPSRSDGRADGNAGPVPVVPPGDIDTNGRPAGPPDRSRVDTNTDRATTPGQRSQGPAADRGTGSRAAEPGSNKDRDAQASSGARGGSGPVRKGQAGVEQVKRDIEASGGRILGEEISVDTPAGRTRPDLFVELPTGQKAFVEVKNGPRARVNPRQRQAFELIRSQGGVPRGSKAAEALDPALMPGVPIGPTPVWVVHLP